MKYAMSFQVRDELVVGIPTAPPGHRNGVRERLSSRSMFATYLSRVSVMAGYMLSKYSPVATIPRGAQSEENGYLSSNDIGRYDPLIQAHHNVHDCLATSPGVLLIIYAL
jgi:hypothetical protein